MKKASLSIVTILLIGLLAACSNQDKDANKNNEDIIIPVETVEATEGDLVIEKTLYGRTAPMSSTPVIVQVPGEFDVLEVENGDIVEEDDVLAKLKTPAGMQNIKAPKKGEVIQLKAKEGDMVAGEELFAVIADMKEMKVNFTVTSNVQSLLKKEDKHKALINNKKYKLEIISIGKMPDETGLYPIEASVKNKEDAILPGMIATMYIPEKRVKKAIILPTEAIIEENQDVFVYVVKDGQAIKTEISIKESQSDQTAIEGEVSEGDQVVINGQLTLKDGSKVDVVKEGNKS